MRVPFNYWRRQLSFISAEETLRQVMNCLAGKQPGVYLRFGRMDIDAALGIRTSAHELPDALAVEVRSSFLLSGKNIFKALHIDCSKLGFPLWQSASGISDSEALDRLNAVGACFLDWPIYSYTAFSPGSHEQAELLKQFFESLRTLRPILVFKEGKDRSAERFFPSLSIAVPQGEDIYDRLAWLEGEILRAVESAAGAFPLVIIALGVSGRVLVKRLLKRGFPGYLLDMDSLQEFPYDKPFSMHRFHLPQPMEKPLAGYGPSDKLAVRWEGPLLGHYSYSIINRELCARLARADGIDLSIRPGDTPFTADPFTPSSSSSFRSIVERVGKHFPNGAHIHIGNHAHHPFSPPLEGRWVVIQPWDYMSLPVRWVDWIQTQIDEVWVPSHFVSSAFFEAGISAEHVAVVPNGVDVQLYRPEARKVRLDTKKSFKFLFVGGPFWRKGFDILLEAYGKAFTARDDVCLVIKSAPEFWTNAGTRWLAAFRARAAAPEILSIVQSIDQQRMAGLYASCDCLVHPYRAEGFAICIAEGMASGLPVIVTGRGAAMDFCNSNTAYLIPAGLRHMDTKQVDDQPTLDYPSYAEPELDGLVEWMRYVYEHPNKSGVTARAGMNKIRAEFTWDHAAEIAIQRLTALSDKPIQRMKRN